MLTQEEFMDILAMRRQGLSISEIAKETGRNRVVRFDSPEFTRHARKADDGDERGVHPSALEPADDEGDQPAEGDAEETADALLDERPNFFGDVGKLALQVRHLALDPGLNALPIRRGNFVGRRRDLFARRRRGRIRGRNLRRRSNLRRRAGSRSG